MVDLYESKNGISHRVATIPFSEVLRDFGMGRFMQIQRLLDRHVVYVRQDSTIDSTLRADGGRVEGKQHHSQARPSPLTAKVPEEKEQPPARSEAEHSTCG